jgi:hypothetical protein
MNYTEEITLEQAQLLPESIIVYSPISKQEPIDTISNFNLTYIYYNNNAIYLTRSDYATYIIGNKPVPEGYGYPNKELSRVYEGLEYRCTKTNSKFVFELPHQNNLDKWWLYIFHSEDLARVEAEVEPSMPAHFADSADWKAKYEAQAAELDEIRTRLRRSSDEVSERKEMLGELKLQLQEATASADSKQQTIEATTKVNNELGDCLRAARDYIEKLEQLGNTQTLLERHTKEKEFAQSAYYETLPF